MENYKIKVNDEAESKEAQELFFELGYKIECFVASRFPRWLATTDQGEEYWYSTGYEIEASLNGFQELTLPQLRDLVVLHRNDVRDATHTDKRKEQIYLTADKVIYYWQGEWCKSAINKSNDYENYIANSLTPIKKPEQGLISGADALRALADGKDVQWISKDFPKWDDLDTWNANTRNFLDEKCIIEGGFKYRLKPRTIKLEIEIPACGKNYKHGQLIWILNSLEPNEYCSVILDESDELPAYWWETEEEIKKVVAALRGIKG
jgi:hypothetical protein